MFFFLFEFTNLKITGSRHNTRLQEIVQQRTFDISARLNNSKITRNLSYIFVILVRNQKKKAEDNKHDALE